MNYIKPLKKNRRLPFNSLLKPAVVAGSPLIFDTTFHTCSYNSIAFFSNVGVFQ
jgi:hypothetical protein